MFTHHLKLAFRNLRKYKTQNIISVIGLAIGFTCFAFSALWIRYEMSYDSFHPKADRIYRVNTALFKWNTVESGNSNVIQEDTSYPLANWLKSTYPEIEEACAIRIARPEPLHLLYLDYNFCKIFDLPLPDEFFIKGQTDRPIAVIPELNNEEVAASVKEQFHWDVRMTIPRWPVNTNIQFNTVIPITFRFTDEQLNNWNVRAFHTYILIKDGVNIQALKEKLDKVEVPEWHTPISLVLTPIKQLRYKDPTVNIQSDIKFSHIQIFAIAGLLVILCSLFNHLTLYVTRVRMRLRELALRKVNGATDWQIAASLYTDFLLVIVLALVVGFMLMAWLLPTFKEYAAIGNNRISIYAELMFYAAWLIVCGFIVGGVIIMFFQRKVLNDSIKGFGKPGSRNLFRKGSLLVQLIISLGLMFCSSIFIKQMHFLHHTDLGVNRRNVAAVSARCCPLPPHYASQFKQIPGITDALPVTDTDFLRDMAPGTQAVVNEKETYTYSVIVADKHFIDFFGVEIIEGSGDFDKEGQQVFNETAMKEMGEVLSKKSEYIGVSRDFYLTPTIKVKPTSINYVGPNYRRFKAIVYRYEEGMRKQTEQAVTQWFRKEFPDQGEFEINFTYMEDIFNEYFKSERALLTLLSVMTMACILIAVFGVYSLTSLTCQQRRKEIAIRKVHGAEILDIMNIFFKEYLILLGMAALLAFPAGYLIMKRWLEGYVKQTSMEAWLFVAIFLAVFVVIVFSILSTVWRAANRNPAEVVKSE